MLPLLAVTLTACPPRQPIDFGLRGRITDPAIALEAVLARRSSMRSVRGEARAAIESPQGSGKLTQFVAAEAPDQVRIDSISFFGNPVAVLASDGDTFQFHDLENNRLFEGPATPENVSRLLPVRLLPEELVSLLLGIPPLIEGAEPRRLVVDDERRAYVLTVGRGADEQLIGLDPTTLRPRFVAMGERGTLSSWTAVFEEYEGEADLPKVVRLVAPGGKSKIELSWREREVNPDIGDDVYRLQVADSVERVSTGR